MTRRLVVTADDLGRTAADSRVVLDLFAEGAVSAVTLMPVTPFAEGAAAEVRGRPGVRVHGTLVSDGDVPPWRPITSVPSLVDDAGYLRTDPVLTSRCGRAADVVTELAAQVAWLRERVGEPAGLDAHTALVYGAHGADWLGAVLELCAREGLAFRLPRDARPYLHPDEVAAFAAPHARAVAAADALGVPVPAAMVTNRTSAAEHRSYDRFVDAVLRRLSGLPEGTSELFCHPGVPGPDDPATLRGWEARMLRDPRFTDALTVEGFTVVPQW